MSEIDCNSDLAEVGIDEWEHLKAKSKKKASKKKEEAEE